MASSVYVRVPYADIGPVKIPDGVTDEQALFISDAFPTGYSGADYCRIKRRFWSGFGDTEKK